MEGEERARARLGFATPLAPVSAERESVQRTETLCASHIACLHHRRFHHFDLVPSSVKVSRLEPASCELGPGRETDGLFSHTACTFRSSSYSTTSIMNRIRSTAPSCDPYSSFGSLNVDTSDPDKNQWVPFDPQCSPPSFLSKLRNEDTDTDFSWLNNRTALVIGDAISREHVENFCQLMGEESEVIRATHKWAQSPKPMRAATKAAHSVDRPKRLDGRGYRVVRDASRPRLCYIPKYDFLVSTQRLLALFWSLC